MANIFDLLMNRKGQDLDYEVKPLNPIVPIQMREDGTIYQIPQPIEKPVTLGERMNNALFGRRAIPTDSVGGVTTNPNGTAQVDSTVSENPRVGGFFNDLSQGYNENRNTPISLDNFGQNKNFATRMGEGLGSIARFADSPAGRALIMGGLVGATGGGALPALAFGAVAGVGNQRNRMGDTLYRRALEEQGIDTTGIKGYIGDNSFAKLVDANIARDNAEFRKMYYDQQAQNQKDMMQWRINQEEAERRQREFENYLKSRGLDLEYAKFKAGLGKNGNNAVNLAAVSNQLNRFEKSFKNMPGKLESNTLGRIRNATGFQTETEANFNSQRTLLFNKIARDLGGEKGVLSDQDIKRIENALPNYTDSYAQKQAKMQAIYDLLEDRLNAEGLSLSTNNNNDPLGIR